jgi:hypothetical protein
LNRSFLILCSLPAALTVCAQNRLGDYLAPELRAQVNQLKRESLSQPTNPQNAVERGLILWQWINAYSLTGGPVPVNATQELGAAFVLNDARQQGGEAATRADADVLAANVDALIYEFRIKDEHPRAVPTVTASGSGPFHASAYVTMTQTVTIGETPLQPGGVIMLAHMLMDDGGNPQITDPKADNYVTYRSSNPKAHFVSHPVPWTGMHGGFRRSEANAGIRLEGEALQPGDRVTFTFGDRSGGSAGLKMPSFSNDKLMFPIYVDLEGKHKFLTPAWPHFTVIGNQAAAVRVTAPSVAAAGEKFELAVRLEDDRRNRATGPIPAVAISLNGKNVRTLQAATEGL